MTQITAIIKVSLLLLFSLVSQHMQPELLFLETDKEEIGNAILQGV